MKKKLLIMGNNKRLMTDFFMQMDFYFDCASTSLIAADLRIHYQFFQPDAIVYCMRAESRDNIVSVTKFVEDVSRKDKVPFVVIADGSDYEFLCKMPGGRSDLRIGSNASVSEIQGEINNIIVRHKNQKIEEMADVTPHLEDTINALAQLETEMKRLDNSAINEKPPMKKLIPAAGRPRILVVDDSTIIHKAIKGYIEKDYDISTALSGAAALRFLQTKEVNLILLDYEMPEMNGAEVLKVLRENPLTANIPVIFLTGVNDTAKIQKVLVLKPDGYLLKPIDKNVLLSKIKEILR